MKIILAITNSVGKNVAFITDDLVARTLEEIVDLVQKKLVDDVHVVSTLKGNYVRANRNRTQTDNLDFLSISVENFLNELKNGAQSEATKLYEKLFGEKLKSESRDKELILIDGAPRARKGDVIRQIKSLSSEVKDAAKKYDIDPNTLGAILIDEYIRAGLDDFGDFFGRFGADTSVGLAQIKMNTARDMIAKGYYKDTAQDISSNDLYNLLANDKTSIAFAAAVIKMHIDHWKPFIDLKDRPEILGTLYSLGEKTPHGQPASTPRGNQIKDGFYLLAKEALNG